MGEVPKRIAHFIGECAEEEGRFFESVRTAVWKAVEHEQGTSMFIHDANGNGSTEVASCEILPTSGVRATVQRTGPVEHLTVWKGPRKLISAERQANAYIVFRHAITPWEDKFAREEAKKTAQR